jgi:hypothetical protein
MGKHSKPVGERFFFPINFPEADGKPPVEKKPLRFNEDLAAVKFTEIRKEIHRMESGVSDLRGPVHFEKGGAQVPMLHKLGLMEVHGGTLDDLVEFVVLARQDLGDAAARLFAKILAELNPKVKDALK